MFQSIRKGSVLSPAVMLALVAMVFAADVAKTSVKSTAKSNVTTPAPKLEPARFDTYVQPDGSTYFALSLLPQNLPAPAAAHDVMVLFDTSASQTGAFRDKGIASLRALLDNLGDNDRVLLAGVDLHTAVLSDGFVAPHGRAVEAALDKLLRRVPLGATDFGDVLTEAMKQWDGHSTASRTMVYIGDGNCNSNDTDADLKSLAAPLVEGRVAVDSLAIGPQLGAAFLAALSNRTGGVLVIDKESLSEKEIGAYLASATRQTVAWPTSVNWPAALTAIYPAQLPPLRSDRDTIVIGTAKKLPTTGGAFDLNVAAEINGKPAKLAWNVAPKASLDDNAYLIDLVDKARLDGGVSLPTLGTDGLWEARRVVNLDARHYVTLGRQAVAAGNSDQAKKLLGEALRIDPSNANAKTLLDSLDGSKHKTIKARAAAAPDDLRIVKKTPVGDPAATPPQPDDDQSLLADTVRQTQIERQVLVAEVNRELTRSRDMMSIDPRGVLVNMRALEERVRRSAALTPDIRANLHKQIEAIVSRAMVRADEREREEVIFRDRKGQIDQINRELARLSQGQIKIKTLMDRFDKLMNEGKYVEAEETAAVEVRALEPSSTLGVSANLIARTVGYHMANMAVRESTQRGYMDELALCDKSHIPFPDDVPIVYPDAKTWTELSKSRKKYASVDLKKQGGAEEKIAKALDEPTQLEFIETPLSEVIDYLKDLHGIEIQLDQKALDAAGVAIDIPVTRNLKGVTLRSALRLMLKQLDLTYVIQNEVLMITSAEEASNKLITKVYPVADLVLPIKDTGFTGGFGGLTGGLGGQGSGQGVGGGAFGGGGQGGFGGQGGGGFGGGQGFQSVPDELQPTNQQTTAVSTTAGAAVKTPVNASPRPQPAAGPNRKIEPIVVTIKPGEDAETAWNHYFTSLPVLPPLDETATLKQKLDRHRAVSDQDAAVRQTARTLMKAHQYEQAIGMIRAALRNGYAQPWMYEAMALAMQATDQPVAELERVLMSAIDFTSTPGDLMVLAAYMSRIQGLEPRALKLCRQAGRLDPTRSEAFLVGMELAKRLNDDQGIQWACVGILSQAWSADQAQTPRDAQNMADATIDRLRKENHAKQADAFQTAVDNAKHRDVKVKVTWTGPADVDVMMQESTGTVCSARTPHTTSGGVMVGDSFSRTGKISADGYSEEYVAAKAFSGQYQLLIRRIFGQVTAGKVTVDIYTHVGTANETHIHQQIPIGDKDALVKFDVLNGSRQEPLAQEQVAVAESSQMAVNRAVLAQQLESASDPSALRDLAIAREINNPNNPLLGLGRGAVGYQPQITTLPEGTNLAATAVISADRRYVRITALPLFSTVGDVQTFNYSSGASSTMPAAGGGAIGGNPTGGAVGGNPTN